MQEMSHRHSRELDIFYQEHKEHCTNCSKAFSDGMCAHLGYLADKAPAVLCDDCAPLLAETVVRYHWMRNEYEKPAPDEKLWRYMDLAKLIHLVSTSKLYFASADSFEDIFEGAKGVIGRKERWDSFYLDFFREAIKTAPGATPEMLEPERIEKDAHRFLTEMDANGEIERKHIFISCWHSNEYESEAMWKLYSENIKNAVAIQTTAEHLYHALNRDPYIVIGKVKYIDYNKSFSSVNGAYWYKRKSFEHEREVRAVLRNHDTKASGVSIPVNIHTLIDKIYISPYAPKWFEEVVNNVMEKYEVSKPVVCSDMAQKPFY